MANKISGKIIVLTPTQTMTSSKGNSYDSREFVIERLVFDRNTGRPTADPYDTPTFKLIGESCKWLDTFKIGDEVTIDYDLSGRKFEKEGQTRYFNDIRVFRIESRRKTAEEAAMPTADPFESANMYSGNAMPQETPQAATDPFAATLPQGTPDDLPF